MTPAGNLHFPFLILIFGCSQKKTLLIWPLRKVISSNYIDKMMAEFCNDSDCGILDCEVAQSYNAYSPYFLSCSMYLPSL